MLPTIDQTSQSILNELHGFKPPSLPHSLLQLLRACQKSDTSFQEIAELIRRDAAICMNVINLANSAFYGHRRGITCIDKALVVLGIETLKTVAMTTAVHQFFSSFNADRILLLKTFWHRSLTGAMLAKSLSALTGYTYPDEAYLTGLLHNIGQLILISGYTERYVEIALRAKSEDELIISEKKDLGVTHSEAGFWLVNDWNLESFAADAILYHHEPANSVLDAHHLVKIVNLASLLSSENAENQQSTVETADCLFGLTAPMVKEIIERTEREVQIIADSMDIVGGKHASAKKAENTDQNKLAQLAEEVKNFSLVSSAKNQLQQARSKADMAGHIKVALKLLFGLDNCQLFLYDASANAIKATLYRNDKESEQRKPEEISIFAEQNRSIVTNALLQNRITSSLNENFSNLSIVDRQLIRLLRSGGILCLPLTANNEFIGVLVIGIDKNYQTRHIGQQRLLEFFAAETGVFIKNIESDLSDKNAGTVIESHEISKKIREVIHEANNPLSIIKIYLEMLGQKLGNDSSAQKELQIIKEEIDRTGKILLRFSDSNSSAVEKGFIDVNKLINDTFLIFKQSLFITHNIEYQLDLDKSMPPVQTDGAALKQILINLLKNAVEALQREGKIHVTTSDCITIDGKPFIEIVVKDNGPGIPEHIHKNIFKPVQSTKGKNHSGLGLSIVKNLVSSSMKGFINHRSSKTGTEFIIHLPRRTAK
ncbi:MAG: HDOD domain-containing protein [Candidatus Kuenenia sp.]|nr:HDOD domain-containing protein [Candidatus Kuenenia hertensis]